MEAFWLGPKRDEEFYTVSGAAINPLHNGDRWIQYRAIFETEEETKTPAVREVKIEYEVPTAMEEHARQSVPQVTFLDQNYPNPFNASTAIRYDLPFAGRVTLHIYDLMGQRIRTLVDEMKPAGSHRVVWNGKDDGGREVSSGMYLYRLEAGERDAMFVDARRMVLLR